MNTPEHITDLEENQIFVFGSNLNGYHAGGAAKVAKDKFGAIEGIGSGRMGQCYAFPTLGFEMEQRTDENLIKDKNTFYKYVRQNPTLLFLVTKLGLGIAGYDISEIAPLFKDPPKNILLPKEFTDYNNSL